MKLQKGHLHSLAILAGAGILMLVFVQMKALAVDKLVWDQSFEANLAGWSDGSVIPGYGQIERVTSGTDGVSSFNGGWHARIIGDEAGPLSTFDTYRTEWVGDWSAEMSVYLDPQTWSSGEGFDYSVATNDTNGNQRRDFVFHVAQDASTGKMLIGVSNNTAFAVKGDIENGSSYEVSEAGWYTLQHRFSDTEGVLSVAMNVLDVTDAAVFSETLSDPSDTVPSTVGGNRYGWFTVVNVASGLAIDEQQLIIPAPDPRGREDCQKGRYEQYGFKNQGACMQYVNNGKDTRQQNLTI